MSGLQLESLSKETLIKLIRMYAKGWITVDGLWFRGVEEEFGLDAAVKLDRQMWERNIPIEVRRIKETLNITGEGPAALLKVADAMSWMNCGRFSYEYEEITPTGIVFYYTVKIGVHFSAEFIAERSPHKAESTHEPVHKSFNRTVLGSGYSLADN